MNIGQKFYRTLFHVRRVELPLEHSKSLDIYVRLVKLLGGTEQAGETMSAISYPVRASMGPMVTRQLRLEKRGGKLILEDIPGPAYLGFGYIYLAVAVAFLVMGSLVFIDEFSKCSTDVCRGELLPRLFIFLIPVALIFALIMMNWFLALRSRPLWRRLEAEMGDRVDRSSI